jgi:hypothetical protein
MKLRKIEVEQLFSKVDEQWWNAKSERMDAPSKIGTTNELKKVGQWMNLGQLEMRNHKYFNFPKGPRFINCPTFRKLILSNLIKIPTNSIIIQHQNFQTF